MRDQSLGCYSFGCTGRVLMDSDHCIVNEAFFKIRLIEYSRPHTKLPPTCEALVYAIPVSNFAGRSRHGAPEQANYGDRFHEQSVSHSIHGLTLLGNGH